MTEMTAGPVSGRGPNPAFIALVWAWVLIPFAYGVYQLVVKIPALFGS